MAILTDDVLMNISPLNIFVTMLFKKNPVRLQHWCLTDVSGFEIFCQTPKKKKKKSASFKNIHFKDDSINYRKLSVLPRSCSTGHILVLLKEGKHLLFQMS